MSTGAQRNPGPTELFLRAVDEGNSSEVERLLETEAVMVNVCNRHAETPLHIAAGYGKLDVVMSLCRHGATVDALDKLKDTPLYWAARHGHLEVVKCLCGMGANVNSQDLSGETALHVSARYDQPEVLAYLCQQGAELDIHDNDGDTALLCGTWHGYQKVVECLVRAGSSLQSCNKDGERPLHVAAVRGYTHLVKFFCEYGADVNAQDRLGCTALHLATRRSHLEIVQYLCSRKCDVNIQNLNGDTALHDACREGNLKVFSALTSTNCNLDLPNKNKSTCLHLAAKYGHIELVRKLSIAGCDINAVTKNGFTADQMAANNELATLIYHLRQGDLRAQYCNDLIPEQATVNCVKLLVGGASGVGKTELVSSLKCPFIHSLFRKRSSSSLAHTLKHRTHGMAVQRLSVPNVGQFSVWDFSGMQEYYTLHEEFLRVTNSIILLVFSLCDSLEKQLAQLHFWLAMIKSKLSHTKDIQFAGEQEHKPDIVLVGSFVDQLLATSSPLLLAEGQSASMSPSARAGTQVLAAIKEEFKDYFSFYGHVFQLDCRLSQSTEIKALRHSLADLRLRVIELQPKVPLLVLKLSHAVANWQEECYHLPVLTLGSFLHKIREFVNPLVTEDVLTTALLALHSMGEVVYINEGLLCNIIVLDPSWMGMRIFGPALSPENSIIPQLKSITGHISLSNLQAVYPEWDAVSVVNLLEHFELCTPIDDHRHMHLFPCLIKMEPVFGLWEKDPDFTVYAGVHVKCQTSRDIFSPSLFPRVQVCARRAFEHDIEDQELTLWSGGLKCCRGEVEILVRYPEEYRTIELLVRGTEDARMECYSLLQQFYSIIIKTICRVNPGSAFMTEILSAKKLREHKPSLTYTPMEIFAAERGDGLLRHQQMPDVEEKILDVVCCGCEELLIATKSAPYTPLSDIPLLTKIELSRLLDPPDVFGRNWCLLSLQLLFTEEVPKIDKAKDHSSPTDKLLTAWERSVKSSVVTVVDALRAIGRTDAASSLIKGLSPFSNPSNSIVINVPGVALTSYLC